MLFGLSQGQVSHWVGVLTPLVNEALGRELLLPARRPADLERLLKEVPALRLLVIDGAERPIRRPKNKDDQKKDYSGKKKAHRKKNLLVTAERRVVYLSATAAGNVHDKKLADESNLSFPADTLVLKDTGFQGYEPPECDTLQPKKKPRGRELHPIQKTINQVISRVRVTVEHAIAGVKRCRIVADTFRCWRRGLVDEVMLAASGLYRTCGCSPDNLPEKSSCTTPPTEHCLSPINSNEIRFSMVAERMPIISTHIPQTNYRPSFYFYFYGLISHKYTLIVGHGTARAPCLAGGRGRRGVWC